MKKSLYLILLLPLLAFVVTCNKRSKTFSENEKAVDTVNLKAPSHSAKATDDSKAIANIKFYISPTEFEKQKELLKDHLKSENKYSNGAYSIEDYTFRTIQGNFHNDSLYNVRLEGVPVRYEEYDSKLERPYNSLVSVLEEKYGAPSFKKNLPRWSDVSEGELLVLAKWNAPHKRILIWITCMDSEYRIDLTYYLPGILKLKQEQMNKDFRKDRIKAIEMF